VSIVTLLLIALGLSADAFAVALGKGLQMRRFDVRSALALACTFGAFQAAMPLLGWALGSQFERYITTYDHWIAFALLTIVGVKMLRDAASPEEAGAASGEVGLRELLVLGLATSIDALAVGIGLAFLDVSIVPASVVIGVMTLLLSYLGVVIGHRAG
jgi:putative Mn2+ efflux pump MntP